MQSLDEESSTFMAENEADTRGELIDWGKLTDADVVELLSRRVIHETEDIIALDKPYGLPYSGSKRTRRQIDRILQELRARLCSNCERFYLVESLDRCASGILLFAKTAARHKELANSLREHQIGHRFRVIVRGVPEMLTAEIAIPLRKKLNGKDMRLLPLKTDEKKPANDEKKTTATMSTRYRIVNENSDGVSLIDVSLEAANVHQIRSHLAFGINCPLVGESKYNPKRANEPVQIRPSLMKAIGYEPKDFRKVPMFIHLSEILLPPTATVNTTSIIKAPLPKLFLEVIKRLSLFKK